MHDLPHLFLSFLPPPPCTAAHHGGQAWASCAHANIGSPLGVPLIFNISISLFFLMLWDLGMLRTSSSTLFSKNLFISVLAMYLFGNKINIWTHHSIWLVFSGRGGVSISPSCGKSAAAVLSHYRTSLYSIKKNSIALLNKIILIPHPPSKT